MNKTVQMTKSIRVKSFQKFQMKSIRMGSKRIYKLKVYEWKKLYEWKKYKNEKKYANEKTYANQNWKKSKRVKIIRIENRIEWKTVIKNGSLTKPNGKCTQQSKKLVLSDTKCKSGTR